MYILKVEHHQPIPALRLAHSPVSDICHAASFSYRSLMDRGRASTIKGKYQQDILIGQTPRVNTDR
jgi:hypothetical protein